MTTTNGDEDGDGSHHSLRRIRRRSERLLGFQDQPSAQPPTVPTNLTELPDSDLMELFVRLTQWAKFFQHRLVQAEIEERNAEQVLELRQARYVAAKWSGGKDERINALKAERDADPEISDAKSELNQKWATRKLAGVLYGGVDRDSFLVSREISRRQGSGDRERRVDRWST